jgi:SH3-like domain-containing protein
LFCGVVIMHTLFTLLFAFFLVTFSSVGSFPAGAADFVSVAKDNINIRTGPGTNNPVHLELFEGYPLKVVGKEGSWLKVTDFENDSGWIESSLTRTNDTVIVKSANNVNLRSAPNITSDIVVTLEKGVVLKKIGMQDQWLHVRHNSGVSGWIHQNLVWP